MSTKLQQLNGQNKVALWVERISECRNSGLSVKTWRRSCHSGKRDPHFETMLNDFECVCPVCIACGYTDLRRGIGRLAGIARTQFQMDPFQTALFLFCGRRRDRIKALYWEDIVPEGTPTEVVEHRLSEEERTCDVCGAVMEEIGREVHRSLQMEPARFWIREDVYYTYACRSCEEETDEANILKTPKQPALCRAALPQRRQWLTLWPRNLSQRICAKGGYTLFDLTLTRLLT